MPRGGGGCVRGGAAQRHAWGHPPPPPRGKGGHTTRSPTLATHPQDWGQRHWYNWVYWEGGGEGCPPNLSLDLGRCSRLRGATHPFSPLQDPHHHHVVPESLGFAVSLCYCWVFWVAGPRHPPRGVGDPPQSWGSPPHIPFEVTTGDDRFQAEATSWELLPLDSCHCQVWPWGSLLGNGGPQDPSPWATALPGVGCPVLAWDGFFGGGGGKAKCWGGLTPFSLFHTQNQPLRTPTLAVSGAPMGAELC